MSVDIHYQKLLSEITFSGIGGPAVEILDVDDLEVFAELWEETIVQQMPKIVIGKGSNILFSDRGFSGRVFRPSFENLYWRGARVTVEVGKSFQSFIEATNQKGFADLCALSGIPGTVGGFVRGNAGALGVEVSDFCIGVEYLDEKGQLQNLAALDCGFGYRESVFKKKPDWCLVRATFELRALETCFLALEKTKSIQKARWQKNPAGRSSGCLFKNPSGGIAGKLLDASGAKGDRVGAIQISEKHANFFMNLGGGTQKDILILARRWRDRVQKEFGVLLEAEVFICDALGERIDL